MIISSPCTPSMCWSSMQCLSRWSHPRKFGPIEMTPREGSAHFSAKVKVPLDAFKMDFVFSDVQVWIGDVESYGS